MTISNLKKRLACFTPKDVSIALMQTAEHPLRFKEKTIGVDVYRDWQLVPGTDIFNIGNTYFLSVTRAGVNGSNGPWKDTLQLPSYNSLVNLIEVIEEILK